MGEHKHTRGPWGMEVRRDGNIEVGPVEPVAAPVHVVVLATVYGDDDAPGCWPVTANAKLIAAAPTLADALEAALDALAETRDQLRSTAKAYWELEHPRGAGATYNCAAYDCDTRAAEGSDYCEHHDPLTGDHEASFLGRLALRQAGRISQAEELTAALSGRSAPVAGGENV